MTTFLTFTVIKSIYFSDFFILIDYFLDIDADTLRVIIDVIYRGKIELDRYNVGDVLIAAEYLGMDFIMDKCSEFYAFYEMDYNLVLEIRIMRKTHGHITQLQFALEKSNNYIKVNH